jgi:hypothetical protein
MEANHSLKRLQKILMLKRKNINLFSQLVRYREPEELSEYKIKFLNSLCSCSNFALIKSDDQQDVFINVFSCKSKLCNVCNYLVQKKIRRLYIRFFNENPSLFLVEKNGTQKVTTASQLVYRYLGWQVVKECSYGLMHLVLTLPHYEGKGFKGKQFYYSEIVRMFNWMRKDKDFLKYCYGGEYGVETTKNENGYHIHIHALLLVDDTVRQYRNLLHKEIFKIWNSLTKGSSNRTEISDDDRYKIKKSNELIDDAFVERLHPSGATITRLENIYYIDKKTGEKRYVINDETKMWAVLETISYHYKPKIFAIDKNYELYDVESILEISKNIKGFKMYNRFGCLYGDTTLKMSGIRSADDSIIEDYAETKEFLEMIGEEQKLQMSFCKYLKYRLLDLYVKDNKLCLKFGKSGVSVSGRTTGEALCNFVQGIVKSRNYKS